MILINIYINVNKLIFVFINDKMKKLKNQKNKFIMFL